MEKRESEYSKLLRDPRWQKKRLEILNRDKFQCVLCGNDNETLHVHHKIYKSGKKPWEYENSLLVTLCDGCHENEKNNMEHYLNCLHFYLKDKFFSSDIFNIMHGFSMMENNFPYGVFSSAFEWFLSKNGAKIIVDSYFNNLKKSKKNQK